MLAPEEIRICGDGSILYRFRNQLGLFESIYSKNILSMSPSFSVSISTQVGCQMGCTFCSNGQKKFSGNLSAAEMVGQVDAVLKDVIGKGKEKWGAEFNILLLGIGEPLMNYVEVVQFLVLASQKFPILNRFDIWTVGIPERIISLAQYSNIRKRLFVSIHSPYEEERLRIMPIAGQHSLGSILQASQKYGLETQTRVVANYILLKGVNDSEQHARDFAKLLDPNLFEFQVYLLSEKPGIGFQRPELKTAMRFRDILGEEGLGLDVQFPPLKFL